MKLATYIFNSFVIIGMMVSTAPYATAQQGTQFTQYMFNTMIINPAYAGAEEALSLTFIQRSQWAGIENAPSTQTFSGHTLFLKKQMGLGLTMINDKIGVHRNLNGQLNGAYHLRVGSKSHLSMGIRAGVHNRKSDYASIAGSSFDPKINNSLVAYTSFDIGAGIFFRNEKVHAGISVPDLVPETVAISDTVSIRIASTNVFGYCKYRFNVSEAWQAEPSTLLKYLSGVPFSFDANFNMIYRKVLTTGLSYRNKESIDFIFRGQVTPQLQIGYAYDHPIGVISRISNGSHELMVNYLFRYVQNKVSSPR